MTITLNSIQIETLLRLMKGFSTDPMTIMANVVPEIMLQDYVYRIEKMIMRVQSIKAIPQAMLLTQALLLEELQKISPKSFPPKQEEVSMMFRAILQLYHELTMQPLMPTLGLVKYYEELAKAIDSEHKAFAVPYEQFYNAVASVIAPPVVTRRRIITPTNWREKTESELREAEHRFDGVMRATQDRMTSAMYSSRSAAIDMSNEKLPLNETGYTHEGPLEKIEGTPEEVLVRAGHIADEALFNDVPLANMLMAFEPAYHQLITDSYMSKCSNERFINPYNGVDLKVTPDEKSQSAGERLAQAQKKGIVTSAPQTKGQPLDPLMVLLG